MSAEKKSKNDASQTIDFDKLPYVLTLKILEKLTCREIILALSTGKSRIEDNVLSVQTFQYLTSKIRSPQFEQLEQVQIVTQELGTYSLKEWPIENKKLKNDQNLKKAVNTFYTKCLFTYLYNTYRGESVRHKWYDAIIQNSVRKDKVDDKRNSFKETLDTISKKKIDVTKNKKELFVLDNVNKDEIKKELEKIQKVEKDIENFKYFTDVKQISRGAPAPGRLSTKFNILASDNVRKLVLPNGVKEIRLYAFQDAEIQEIHLPDSLEIIEESAFRSSKLKSISIPDSVTAIEDNAFMLCTDLTRVKLSNSLQKISSECFANAALESVEIPNRVKEIGKWSFYNNGLKTLALGNSVKYIYAFAFRVNYIKTLTIPNSVAAIGREAFYRNEITNLVIPNNVQTIKRKAFARNKIKTLALGSGVTRIEKLTFADNNLVDLIIPFNVKIIGFKAFFSNKIETLIIPNSVTTIASKAFANNKITIVIIPGSVTTIESEAFANNKITSVRIPGSVTDLADDAFDYNVEIMREGDVTMTGSSNKLQDLKF